MLQAIVNRPVDETAVVARGWVEAIQDIGPDGDKLIDIRGQGRTSSVFVPAAVFADGEPTLQSTVEVFGAPGGGPNGEPTAEVLRVRSRAAPLPVKLDEPCYDDTRYRHLHIRTPLLRATAMFRHFIQKYARAYLDEHGFFFVQTPILTEASCVCSGDVFTFPYYNKKIATLIQSPWMYADALVSGVEKVYALNPSFRREREATRTHLVEIWQLQVDLTWASNADIMDLEEGLIRHLAASFLSQHTDLFELAGLDASHLEAMLRSYQRITYEDAVARINQRGVPMGFGDDFSDAQLGALSATFDRPYFVTNYPQQLKNFWFPSQPDGNHLTPSNDLFAHTGQGEIIGGGERVYDVEELERNLEYFGHDLDEFDWFVETRRFGGVPHAGFSVGFDRLTALIMGVDHINKATLFPRLPHGGLRP
jgi:asparaginyl-tRNA synthetase